LKTRYESGGGQTPGKREPWPFAWTSFVTKHAWYGIQEYLSAARRSQLRGIRGAVGPHKQVARLGPRDACRGLAGVFGAWRREGEAVGGDSPVGARKVMRCGGCWWVLARGVSVSGAAWGVGRLSTPKLNREDLRSAGEVQRLGANVGYTHVGGCIPLT